MNQFCDLMDKLKMDTLSRETILSNYKKNPRKYENAASCAYKSDTFDYPICKNSPLDRLIIWCCLLPSVLDQYLQRNVPEDITLDTVREVTRLSNQYHHRTGRVGLSKDHAIWLRHIYHVQLFQLGSLQFQMFKMVYLDREGCGEDYMCFSDVQKHRLPPGTPVVNVHIPDRADLSPSAVENSFTLAVDLFKRTFPFYHPKAYLCYSWLLYPPMDVLLSEGSHIRDFAARFHIIGSVPDPYGSDAVKRIYGRRFARKADYPQNTSLQRNALGNFSKLGMACGIIEIT